MTDFLTTEDLRVVAHKGTETQPLIRGDQSDTRSQMELEGVPAATFGWASLPERHVVRADDCLAFWTHRAASALLIAPHG